MTLNLRTACIIIVFSIFSTSIFAQQDSIDVFVQQEMQKRKIPGLQLAIVQNGKIIKTGKRGKRCFAEENDQTGN